MLSRKGGVDKKQRGIYAAPRSPLSGGAGCITARRNQKGEGAAAQRAISKSNTNRLPSDEAGVPRGGGGGGGGFDPRLMTTAPRRRRQRGARQRNGRFKVGQAGCHAAVPLLSLLLLPPHMRVSRLCCRPRQSINQPISTRRRRQSPAAPARRRRRAPSAKRRGAATATRRTAGRGQSPHGRARRARGWRVCRFCVGGDPRRRGETGRQTPCIKQPHSPPPPFCSLCPLSYYPPLHHRPPPLIPIHIIPPPPSISPLIKPAAAHSRYSAIAACVSATSASKGTSLKSRPKGSSTSTAASSMPMMP